MRLYPSYIQVIQLFTDAISKCLQYEQIVILVVNTAGYPFRQVTDTKYHHTCSQNMSEEYRPSNHPNYVTGACRKRHGGGSERYDLDQKNCFM